MCLLRCEPPPAGQVVAGGQGVGVVGSQHPQPVVEQFGEGGGGPGRITGLPPPAGQVVAGGQGVGVVGSQHPQVTSTVCWWLSGSEVGSGTSAASWRVWSANSCR